MAQHEHSGGKPNHIDVHHHFYPPEFRQALNDSDPAFQHRLWVFLDLNSDQLERVSLSPRALERRAKVDPVGFLIDNRDYRPTDAVIQRIEETGATVRYVSRWLKAFVVDADATQTYDLTELPAVIGILLGHGRHLFQGRGRLLNGGGLLG